MLYPYLPQLQQDSSQQESSQQPPPYGGSYLALEERLANLQKPQQKSSQPPPPSWSYVGVPYINHVQPYQGNSRQISGLEPLAMLQRYRQGDSALEQSAQLQQIMGESAPSAAPLVGK